MKILIAVPALVCAAGVAGCVSPQLPLQKDFGMAVRQTLAAQNADPEAKYVREVEPASSGARAADASFRYNKGTVIQPTTQTTANVGGAAAAGGTGAGTGASR